MALPVVYSNSPVAGSIAWDAFTIQYQGVSYSIGAGNTTNRWVWWRYNTGGGTTVIEAGPDVPDGAIDNELLNPSFEEVDPVSATLPRYWLRPIVGGRYYGALHKTELSSVEVFTGTQSVALTTGQVGATGPSIQKLANLTEGATYRLVFRAKGSVAQAGLYAMLLNSTGTTEVLRFATLNPSAALTTSWQVYSGTIVIPVGAASSRLMICSYNKAVGQVAYIDDVEFGLNPAVGLVDDDLVLLGNKNGIPFRVQSTEFVDGDLLIDGSVGVQALSAKVIVANDIYAEDAYLGTIKSDKIETGVLDSTISIVKGALLVGTGITINQANGIKVAGPTGFTQIPTDGSSIQLNGDVVASALTVLGNSKIQGTTNELSTGSKLTVAAGTTPPAGGPLISGVYPTHSIPNPGDPNSVGRFRGLAQFPAEDATTWLTTASDYQNVAHIVKLTKQANGDFLEPPMRFDCRALRPELSSIYGGLTVIGSDVYTMGITTEKVPNKPGAYRWYIYKWHYTGVASPAQSRFTYTTRWLFEPSNYYGGYSRQPGIGTDGVDILVFQSNTNDDWGMARYTSAGVYSGMTPLYQDAGKTNRVNGERIGQNVIVTPADLGGSALWWIATQDNAIIYCFDTTGSRVTANEFSAPGLPIMGLWWDGTRFMYHTGEFGETVYDFSQIKDTDLATNKINAVQTWRLNNSTGPAYATYETSASAPTTSNTIAKRSWLQLTTATPIPDDPANASDPDALTFYLARGTTPANATYKRIPPFFGAGDKGTLTVLLDTLATASGAAPPATTTFLATSSGQIASNGSTPTWVLKGDGSGTLGQAAWDSTGNWSWTTGQQTCCLRQAAAVQSIPNDVASPYTTCTLATISYNSGCDTSVANTIKIVTPGFYVITASAMFDNGGLTTGSRRVMEVRVNGTPQGRAEVRAMDNAEYYTGDIAIQVYLNIGDLVTMQLYQNSSVALNTYASHLPRLAVSKVSSQGAQGIPGAPGPPPAPPQIDSYTTVGNFTWTKPAGATRVMVVTISGGAGGGSGRRGAVTTIRAGGGGGAGGQVATATMVASDLGATENVTVGAGGAGGASIAVDDTNGLIGAVGVASFFGSAATNRWVGTNAPAAGAAGAIAAAAGGVAAAPGGSTGAASSATGAVGTTSNNQLGRGTSWSAGAGGGGGGCTAADVASAGGTGGPGISGSSTAPLGGTLGGGLGGAGQAARTGSYQAGDGGGGGGGSITTAAGKGGDGGFPGGGGGGGGASLNTFASGAGGKGGDGAVYVITYF